MDRVFSLCFGFPSGGTLLLGDAPLPPGVELVYTPLLPSATPYYTVGLDSIAVGGRTLNIEPVRRTARRGGALIYAPAPAGTMAAIDSARP